MKKIILSFFIFLILFLFMYFYFSKNENNLSINLINTANKYSLFNNKLGPGSFGEFIIDIKSRKNIKYIIYLNDFSLPSNFYIYINGNYVDSSKNNAELFTGFTNNVDKLNFKWYWSYYSENIFFSSNFFINLKINFERNF